MYIKFSATFLAIIVLFPVFGMLNENSDFMAQYTAGVILRRGFPSQLYDIECQRKIQTEIKDQFSPSSPYREDLLLFTQPPFTAMVYYPFAFFPYQIAKHLFNLLIMVCLFKGAALFFSRKEISNLFSWDLVFLASVFSPPVWATFIQGQTSVLGWLFFLLAFLALKGQKDFTAGLWLAAALIRFQLLPVFLLFFIFKRKYRVLAGFLLGSSLLLCISICVVGWEGMLKFRDMALLIGKWNHQYGVSPDQAHCLRGQLTSLLGFMDPRVVWILTALAGLILLAFCIKRWGEKWDTGSTPFDLNFATLCVVSLLMAPHLNFHDLSFLILPAWIMYRLMLANRINRAYAESCLALFAFCGMPILLVTHLIWEYTRIQMSVVGLLCLWAALYKGEQYLTPDISLSGPLPFTESPSP
jgi:hypothetical protein